MGSGKRVRRPMDGASTADPQMSVKSRSEREERSRWPFNAGGYVPHRGENERQPDPFAFAITEGGRLDRGGRARVAERPAAAAVSFVGWIGESLRARGQIAVGTSTTRALLAARAMLLSHCARGATGMGRCIVCRAMLVVGMRCRR